MSEILCDLVAVGILILPGAALLLDYLAARRHLRQENREGEKR